MFNIITIGSATRDVFLESNDFRDVRSRQFSSGIGECLSLGSKNTVQRIFFSTGGGATNAAVTFARLGLKVACVARLGNDSAGEEVIESLRREGVDIRFIQKDAHDATAYSTLLMHGPGERTILVYRGASVRLSLDAPRSGAKEGGSASIRKTKWFYITSLGGNLALIKNIWSIARANNIKIAWNPGSEELRFGWTKLSPFIKQCEVFNLNREEASQLVEAKLRRRSETSTKKGVLLQQIFKNLCGHARITLITDGARGAYGCFRESKFRRTPHPPAGGEGRKFGLENFFVSSLGTKPRNTTGAGDAFGSGFVAGLILLETELRPASPLLQRGKRTLQRLRYHRRSERRKLGFDEKIKTALRLALLNADSVIRQMGAKAGILKKMPSKREFDKIKIREL